MAAANDMSPEVALMMERLERAAAIARQEAANLQQQISVEKKRADMAEKRADMAEERADMAEERADMAEERAEAVEEQLRPTDYLTYLSLCHHKLFMSLAVQTDSDLTSAGGVTNVKDKRYPLYLKKWTTFPSLHNQCQQRFEAAFGARKIFKPTYDVDVERKRFADGVVVDERDMEKFQCLAIEEAVHFVANQFFSPTAQPVSDQAQSESSTRPAKIRFLYNPYGLLARDVDGNITDDTPAYVPTMKAGIEQDLESRGRTNTDGPQPSKRSRSPRPRIYPDQWCFQVRANDVHVPIFVIEYKAAHKLPATVLVDALQKRTQSVASTNTTKSTEQDGSDTDTDTDTDTELFMDVIADFHDNKVSTDSTVKSLATCKAVTAHVIAQTFHYMVEFGLCYAYIASGDALLFLYLQPDDPRTLYYHLAQPNKDVAVGDGLENMYNTAVALVLSLVLMGCDTPPLTQRWKKKAYSMLKVWPNPYPEMGKDSSGKDKNLGDTRPNLPAPTPQAGCKDPTKTPRPRQEDDDDDDNEEDNDGSRTFRPTSHSSVATTRTLASSRTRRSTKSTPPQSTTTSGQQRAFDPFCKPAPTTVLPYCTQGCLLSMRRGGLLDRRCPNARLHERTEMPGHHPLTMEQLVKCMRAQLAEDLDEDCEGLDKYGKFGATSMLFRLVLQPYGYCFVGKGVQRPHLWLLEHELRIYEYEAVAAQQGQLVPVCLGLLELDQEYISYTGAHITNMLLLSYGGEPLWKRKNTSLAGADEAHVFKLIYGAWAKLKALGVVHGDEREANVVWNEEHQAVMCIDFGMAELRRLRQRSPDMPSMPDGEEARAKRQRTLED